MRRMDYLTGRANQPPERLQAQSAEELASPPAVAAAQPKKAGMQWWLPAAKDKGRLPGGTAPAAMPASPPVMEAVAERRVQQRVGDPTEGPSIPSDSAATDPSLALGQDTTTEPARASRQIPMAKPVRGRKQPTVEIITQAKSDLEKLYATVSPLLRHQPAGAKYFSDELWRILEVLGRLKMGLSFPDFPG